MTEETQDLSQETSSNSLTQKININPLLAAGAFLQNLHITTIDRFPLALQQRLKNQLSSWIGISSSDETEIDLRELIGMAKDRVERAKREEMLNEESEDTMRMRYRLVRAPGLNFPLEEEYTSEELPRIFPKALELQKIEGSDLKFKLHAHIDGDFFLVERPGGKREVIRFYDDHRPIEEINKDLSQVPEVLPGMKVYEFHDGSVGVLQSWIEGHHPSTDQEKQLCKDASDSLLIIPWEIENRQTPYDLNAANFIVTDSTSELPPRIYYVDKDLVGVFIRNGLSPNPPHERFELLTKGKEKLR